MYLNIFEFYRYVLIIISNYQFLFLLVFHKHNYYGLLDLISTNIDY